MGKPYEAAVPFIESQQPRGAGSVYLFISYQPSGRIPGEECPDRSARRVVQFAGFR